MIENIMMWYIKKHWGKISHALLSLGYCNKLVYNNLVQDILDIKEREGDYYNNLALVDYHGYTSFNQYILSNKSIDRHIVNVYHSDSINPIARLIACYLVKYKPNFIKDNFIEICDKVYFYYFSFDLLDKLNIDTSYVEQENVNGF